MSETVLKNVLLDEEINAVITSHPKLNPDFFKNQKLDPVLREKLKKLGIIYFNTHSRNNTFYKR
ncbi:hypothetical protein [Legionella lansingensis]|uniref:hypothetical protein n=1 Tax=Legionella lansingensis TaxID=45067 RepID=UPI00048AA5AB|nr:hypothetical protein [Legionella lansingensis]